jgi:hypothetical protein
MEAVNPQGLTMLNSLRAISEPTGGFAVLDEADFSGALQRIGLSVRCGPQPTSFADAASPELISLY